MGQDKDDKEKKPDPGSGHSGDGDHGSGESGPGGDHGGGDPGPGGDHGDHGGHGEKITVLVNEKPVTFEKEKQTGLSIKQAAIAQGVQIQIDFVLSIERGGGKTELIGDGDTVKVRDGDRFLAIPNDDNS